jgi:putative ABC transport system ATP-binding protein
MSAPSAILSAKRLVKTYERGRIRALDGVDLEIRRGEFLAVVGPSGSGKSTLLHMIGALDRADSGTILLEGIDLAQAKRLDRIRARSLGFVFQLHNLLPLFTAQENVEAPLYALAMPRAERARRARALLEAVGLGRRLHHRPTQLSGGERQRVAIARALVNEPKLLLADEPTGNLDRAAGEQILDLLLELRRERGVTLVLVTHNTEIAGLAERIVRLEDGRITNG